MSGFAENLEQQLSAYLDGELSPAEAREVDALLAQSGKARDLLEELRSVSARVAALPRIASPMPLDAWAREPLAASAESTSRSRSPRVILFRIASRITAAAALVGVGMFAAWMLPVRSAAPRVANEGSETRGLAVYKQDGALPAPSAATVAEPTLTRSPPQDPGPTVVLRSGDASDQFAAAHRMEGDSPAIAPAPGAREVGRDVALDFVSAYNLQTAKMKEAYGPGDSAPHLVFADGSTSAATLDVVVHAATTEQYEQLQTTIMQWNSSVASSALMGGRFIGGAASSASDEKDALAAAQPGPATPPLARVWDLVRSLDEQTANSGRVAIQLRFEPRQIPQVQSFIEGAGFAAGESPTGVFDSEEGAGGGVSWAAQEDAASQPADERQLQNLGYVGASDKSRDDEQPETSERADAGLRNEQLGFGGEAVRKAEAKSAAAAAPETEKELRDEPRGREAMGQPMRSSAPARGGREKTPAGDAPPRPGEPLEDRATRLPAAPRSQPTAENAALKAELPASAPASPDLFKQFRDVTGAIGQGADRILRYAIERIEKEVRRGSWSQGEALGRDAGADNGANAAPLKLRVMVMPPVPASAPATTPAEAPR